MSTVVTICGREVLIDECDLGLLGQYKWRIRSGYGREVKAYVACFPKQTTVYLHRVIMSAQKGQIVDHKNGNTLDNRRCNLRFATHAGNSANSIRRKPASGFRGVYQVENSSRFKARIGNNSADRYLGIFDTAEQAAVAYDTAALAKYGEFAKLNFPLLAHERGLLAARDQRVA